MTADVIEVPVYDKRHHWEPSPRQMEVIRLITELPEEEFAFLGYGGAAGGGKTNLLAQLFLEIALQCPGAKLLLGRQHLVDLKSTTLAEFDSICPPEVLVKRYDSVPIYRDVRLPSWPKGVTSRIYFRQVKDAANGIGSEEYGAIGIEEAHECDKRDITYLFGRLRHRPERKRFMLLCFNPFPSYATDVFINGTEKAPGGDVENLPAELKELVTESVLHTHFVPAKVFDNPHLPKNYAAMLAAAYADDPYYLSVLLKGEAGAVPNSVYGEWLNDIVLLPRLQVQQRPKGLRFTRGVTGWDWGTTKAHKAAGTLVAVDSTGMPWTIDSWESPQGSSDELLGVARGWQAWAKSEGIVLTAAYDRSQGSLKDDLEKVFGSAVGGVRDVEGRIREGRGLFNTLRARFAWWMPGAREVWRYLKLYHRDDKGAIVEVMDDIPDAWHYAIYEAMNPSVGPAGKVSATGVRYRSAPKRRTEGRKTRA